MFWKLTARNVPSCECEVKYGGVCLPETQEKDCGSENKQLLHGCNNPGEFCCVPEKTFHIDDPVDQSVRTLEPHWYGKKTNT